MDERGNNYPTTCAPGVHIEKVVAGKEVEVTVEMPSWASRIFPYFFNKRSPPLQTFISRKDISSNVQVTLQFFEFAVKGAAEIQFAYWHEI